MSLENKQGLCLVITFVLALIGMYLLHPETTLWCDSNNIFHVVLTKLLGVAVIAYAYELFNKNIRNKKN